MATCSTLDLLDADDRAVEDAREWENDDRLLDPADYSCSGDDDNELRCVDGQDKAPARELFIVRGEPTGTSRSRSVGTKKVPRTRPLSATSTRSRSRPTGWDGGNQSAAAENGGESNFTATRLRQDKHEAELQVLREQLEQTRRELMHSREEREELQVAFRRLDQEIMNGYNLAERKEKEMKIAELLAKNLKVSQMLEKELKVQEALRAANADLQTNVERLERQVTLLNQVLASVESKHSALVETHSQLTSSHLAAQERIVGLQAQIHQFEASDTKSTIEPIDYEEKLRLWESKCAELQRKVEDKGALLRAEQGKNSALERTCEQILEERNALETEVASVHDKMIQMNGAMKTMEATVEASTGGTHGSSIVEQMKVRIRVLEEEMLGKNRLIIDLKESVNGLLHGRSAGNSHNSFKRRHPGAKVIDVKNQSVSSRIVTVTQRLRKAEEARDHKSRCLNVLLAILPQLLQQLDALQDKFHATLESNGILSHAIEQLQSDKQDTELRNEPAVALAREGYLLSGPYQPELLMGFTLNRALSEIAPPPPKKLLKSMPFNVRARVNISDNSASHGELLLAADPDDSSGVAYLNRSKINPFLHFVQGSATKAKCKHLLVQKIADLLSSHRELMYNYSTECAFYKASIAKLEAELHHRTKQLAEAENQVDKFRSVADGTMATSRRSKLLLKLIEAIAEGPQQRQNTFLTQAGGAYMSDMLILGEDARGRVASPVTLDLSDCGIRDEDLEPLLLKISVGSYLIHELNLRDNDLSDDGAATISAFLETYPRSVKIVDLRGNDRITSDGVSRLRNALMQYPAGACRLDEDSARSILSVVAADHDFDTAGRPSVVLQLYLPEQARRRASAHDQGQSVQQIIEQLEALGFSGSACNWTRAESVYRPAKSTASAVPRRAKASTARRAGSKSATPQREKKLRALDAAIQRAEKAGVAPRGGVSLTQMKHLLATPCAVALPLAGIPSRRVAKLQFAQSHLATIRGLGKK